MKRPIQQGTKKNETCWLLKPPKLYNDNQVLSRISVTRLSL